MSFYVEISVFNTDPCFSFTDPSVLSSPTLIPNPNTLRYPGLMGIVHRV